MTREQFKNFPRDIVLPASFNEVDDYKTSSVMGFPARTARISFREWIQTAINNGLITTPASGLADGDKGDIIVTASGTDWQLDVTGVTPGTYTTADVTVDDKGRITAIANGSGGVGVTDGDKGDITVSGTGTTWTIDDNTITTAKILNDAVTAAKLADTTVTPGSYIASNITVDAQGRITSASNSGLVGLTDGDKNHIVVSASGTDWQLKDSVILDQQLTGFNTVTPSPVLVTDNIVEAFEKLQAQIDGVPSEVIENAGALAGAAPTGAKLGVDTSTGASFYVSGGNWTASPTTSDTNITTGTILAATDNRSIDLGNNQLLIQNASSFQLSALQGDLLLNNNATLSAGTGSVTLNGTSYIIGDSAGGNLPVDKAAETTKNLVVNTATGGLLLESPSESAATAVNTTAEMTTNLAFYELLTIDGPATTGLYFVTNAGVPTQIANF